ncbi:MAG: YraN family protein [Oscillospiraceae bacterium]|nr:YraN family protein [Oscillospiraceae bacterium]
MSGDTSLLGKWGEEQVARYLRVRGYTVLAAGFRCRMGEIDLIVRRRELVAFVEVKLRKNADFARALEQVTRSKQRRIITTAKVYLAQHPELADCPCRFDVAEVYAPQGTDTRRPEIRYLENAFW